MSEEKDELRLRVAAIRDELNFQAVDIAIAAFQYEQDEVWDRALSLHDEAREMYRQAREALGTDRSVRAKYVLKLERRAVGVSLKGAEMLWVGPTNLQTRRDRIIGRGSSNEYKIGLFPQAPAWEKSLIQHIEVRAAPIRAWTARVRRLFNHLNNMQEPEPAA